MADIRAEGVLYGQIAVRGVLSGTITAQAPLGGAIDLPEIIDLPEYEGSYDVTPSDTTQTIEIKNKRATENIVINPIPSNYGKITWDGSVLTVS